MRLWLSKNSEVALREQLATQIILGIISEDLKPDQRLPSTRELARRFRIHPNTVSAAYRDLAKRGWVEARRGSGIYVRDQASAASAGEEIELDRLISTLFKIARQKGYLVAEISSRVERWLRMQPPDHFLVVEPDPQLRDILVAEIEEATGMAATGAAPDQYPDRAHLEGAAVVMLQGMTQEAQSAIGREATCLLLRMRSIQAELETENRLTPDKLVTVVSGWEEFLKWARTVLVAAGVEPAAISLCDRSAPGWQKGLRTSELVITDALTARLLPPRCRARVFRIIADSSLDELRHLNEARQTSVTV